MKRVLFIAEAVTLAHAARPFVLAKSLDCRNFDVHFAMEKRYPLDFGDASVRCWPIRSISQQEFLEALAKGRPVYSADTLADYVKEDLTVLDQVKPDIVIGDFRLSLAVSAPLRGVHYVSIANAHWSPYSRLKRLPFPEHPLGMLVGVPVASWLFNLFQPFVLALHAAPLNRVRRAYGLAAFGSLHDVYTWANTTLYADVPQLVATDPLPSNHAYIGPILWSPEVPRPDWWSRLSTDEICVYVTLGSSGQIGALAAVLEGLSELRVTVLLATAGRTTIGPLPPNVRVASYLPGAEAARLSAAVVCNGGSATVYQVLAEGVPVLGLPSNLDQHLTMASVATVGAGLTIRAEAATATLVREAVRQLLTEPRFAAAARRVSGWFATYSAEQRFADVLTRLPGALF